MAPFRSPYTWMSFIDSLKEPYRAGRGQPLRIDRLEAACIRFPSSLFGYRRSEVTEYQDRVVKALAQAEDGGTPGEAPPSKFRRSLVGASPRFVDVFTERATRSLEQSPEVGH
jgi:hypothetical protein